MKQQLAAERAFPQCFSVQIFIYVIKKPSHTDKLFYVLVKAFMHKNEVYK